MLHQILGKIQKIHFKLKKRWEGFYTLCPLFILVKVPCSQLWVKKHNHQPTISMLAKTKLALLVWLNIFAKEID